MLVPLGCGWVTHRSELGLPVTSRRGGRFWLFGRQWNKNPDGPVVLHEVLLGDALDVFGGDRAYAFQKLIHPPPACANGFRLPEQHGVAKIRILFEYA